MHSSLISKSLAQNLNNIHIHMELNPTLTIFPRCEICHVKSNVALYMPSVLFLGNTLHSSYFKKLPFRYFIFASLSVGIRYNVGT